MAKAPARVEPCRHVHGEAVYWFRHPHSGESWWDGCVAIEAAFVSAGWTPPADYVPAEVARRVAPDAPWWREGLV